MNSNKPIRKMVQKRCETGQVISLTPQDDRILKQAYEYLSGFCKRQILQAALDSKREEVVVLSAPASPTNNSSGSNHPNPNPMFLAAQREYEERRLDALQKAKDEVAGMEERLIQFGMTDHKISANDLEAVTKHLGVNLSRKVIDHMLWEVDEDLDQFISLDELQLTYTRNVKDATGNEPCLFFRLLEFITFDPQNKGYVIEDDCMEMLFARYGSGKLEKELQVIFGDRLRVAGGDGTLDLAGYLAASKKRPGGRRALLAP